MGRTEVGSCPDCKEETEIVVDDTLGHCVCSQCGLVVEAQFIDDAHDARIFEDNQSAQRIETARDGKAGEIASITIQGKGRGRGRGQTTYSKQFERLSENKKKALVVPANHVEQIEDYASALNLGRPVIDRAQDIYREFVESGGYTKGKNVGSLQVACLYIAGRQLGQMRMMKEIAEVTDVKQPDIRKGDIKIRRVAPSAAAIDINDITGVVAEVEEEMPLPELSSDQYAKAAVDRLCNALKFEFRQRKCAEEMANAVVKLGMVSMQPASVAAAIVWTCSRLFGRNDDIKLIVEHSVGKNTIRRAYNMLKPHFTSLISKDIFGDLKDWEKKLKRP